MLLTQPPNTDTPPPTIHGELTSCDDLGDILADAAGIRLETQRHRLTDYPFFHTEPPRTVKERAAVNLDVDGDARIPPPWEWVDLTGNGGVFRARWVDACRVRGRAVLTFEVEAG